MDSIAQALLSVTHPQTSCSDWAATGQAWSMAAEHVTCVPPLSQELFRASAMEVCGTLKVPYDDVVIDLEAPFRRASMHALVCKATGLDFRGWAGSIEEARAAAEARLTEMGVKGKAVSAVRGGEGGCKR